MTRNDSDADVSWIGKEVKGSIPPRRNDDGTRKPRQPMNWPTAAFGIALLAALVAVAWLCAGVSRDWIAQ